MSEPLEDRTRLPGVPSPGESARRGRFEWWHGLLAITAVCGVVMIVVALVYL